MEERKEGKRISSRAMESAMAARLLLNLLRGDASLARSVAIATAGFGEIAADWPRAHPSFERSENAIARLAGYVDRLLAGEIVPADPNPILRISRSDGRAHDFSLESFAGAALGDDGILAMPSGISEAPAGSRSRLALEETVRVALYGADGEPIRRSRAIIPVREILEARKRVIASAPRAEASAPIAIASEGADSGSQPEEEATAFGEPFAEAVSGREAEPEILEGIGAETTKSEEAEEREGEEQAPTEAETRSAADANEPTAPTAPKESISRLAGSIDEARFRIPPRLLEGLLGALSALSVYEARLEWDEGGESWRVSVEGEALAESLGPALAALAAAGVSVALRRKAQGL